MYLLGEWHVHIGYLGQHAETVKAFLTLSLSFIEVFPYPFIGYFHILVFYILLR